MKIAVTGASGFIGRYLVETLIGDGHQVVALGRAGSGKPAQAAGGLIARETDYSEEDLKQVFAGLAQQPKASLWQ